MTSSLATASLALVVAALAAGCAAESQAVSNEPAAPREYRTGSNIPVHEPRSTTDEDKARASASSRPAPAAKTTN